MKCLAHIRNLLVLLMAPGLLYAQLQEHPSAYPMPDVNQPDPDRALAISVTFSSTTGVTVDDLIVSNQRAHPPLDGPLELRLELLDDKGGILSTQYVRDPLYERSWDENGVEDVSEADEAMDVFFVAISEDLAGVRIRDAEADEILAEVDAVDVIAEFCTENSELPICPVLFKDSFESGRTALP